MNISEDKTNIGGKIYEGGAREGRKEGRKAFRRRAGKEKMNEGRVLRRPSFPSCHFSDAESESRLNSKWREREDGRGRRRREPLFLIFLLLPTLDRAGT